MDGQPIGPPKRSGCIIALYAIFGVGLIVMVAGGVATYLFLQSETGQQFMKVAQEGVEWITVASQAPGTEELRDAGCETAMVSDAASAFEIVSVLIPEEDKQAEVRDELERDAGGYPLDELTLVICTLPRFSVGSPSCDELARTYGSAVETYADSFYVLVMQQGQDEPNCRGVYTPDGTLLAPPPS